MSRSGSPCKGKEGIRHSYHTASGRSKHGEPPDRQIPSLSMVQPCRRSAHQKTAGETRPCHFSCKRLPEGTTQCGSRIVPSNTAHAIRCREADGEGTSGAANNSRTISLTLKLSARRGCDAADGGEIDFAAERDGEIRCYQVSASIMGEAARARELVSLSKVRGNFGKTVLALDHLGLGVTPEGIRVRNALDWLCR